MVKFVKIDITIPRTPCRPVWNAWNVRIPPDIVRAVENLVKDKYCQVVVKAFDAPDEGDPDKIPLAELKLCIGPFGDSVRAVLPARTEEEVGRIARLLELVKKFMESDRDTDKIKIAADIIEIMYDLTTVDENLITYSLEFDNPHGEGWEFTLAVEETWSD